MVLPTKVVTGTHSCIPTSIPMSIANHLALVRWPNSLCHYKYLKEFTAMLEANGLDIKVWVIK